MAKSLLTIFVFAFILFAQGSCSSDISPSITSEDDDIDSGGFEPPDQQISYDLCDKSTIPNKLTLVVRDVENGSLSVPANSSLENPAILLVGKIPGPDPTEPQTRLLLDFVTSSARYEVGNDPAEFAVFFQLFSFAPNLNTEFQADHVLNEPYKDIEQKISGNRVATWADADSLFDGILELNVTYALQACRAYIKEPGSREKLLVRSQPIFIQARLNGP